MAQQQHGNINPDPHRATENSEIGGNACREHYLHVHKSACVRQKFQSLSVYESHCLYSEFHLSKAILIPFSLSLSLSLPLIFIGAYQQRKFILEVSSRNMRQVA